MSFADLLASLVGLRVCQVLVGPAGVHYDFGGTEPEPCAIGIVSNAAITLQIKGHRVIFQTENYPPFHCANELRGMLLGKRVLSAESDTPGNTPRIVLEGPLLLRLTPQPSEQNDVCWSIHDKRPEAGAEKGYVVYSDATSPIRER